MLAVLDERRTLRQPEVEGIDGRIPVCSLLLGITYLVTLLLQLLLSEADLTTERAPDCAIWCLELLEDAVLHSVL